MADKKMLRLEMRGKEEEFMATGRAQEESARILAELEKDPRFIAAKCVLMYMSMPGEVETVEFVRRWSREKTIGIPKVCGENLVFFAFSEDRIKTGYKGIYEPTFDADPVDLGDVDLAVIPGIAFSVRPDGRVLRMGRGKGFYDRILPRLNCPVLAIGYPFRKVDEVPADPWDIALDGLFI